MKPLRKNAPVPFFLYNDFFVILKESVKSFGKNNNSGVAASLAYYGLFALIPLFLLIIYLSGHFIVSSKVAAKGLEDLTSQLLPQFNEVILKEVYSLSKHKGIWGPISIIALFWAVTPLAGALRSAFSNTFNVDEQPSYFKAKLLDVLAVVVILLLFIFLVVSEIFYSKVIILFLKDLPVLLYLSDLIAPLLITMSFMTVFYYVLSPVKLKIQYLLAGSLTTAILWSLIRPGFTLFLTFNPKFGFTFGSLKAIFIILVWVYYSFAVVLFGAEVSANIRKKNALLLKQVFGSKHPSDRVNRKLMEKFGKTYNAGETIFNEGDKGDDMYYVLSGSVNISRKSQTIRVMRQGEYFGEMSMLIQSPRTATTVAFEPETRLLRISQENFELILKEDTRVILSILRELSARLKLTDESILESRLTQVQTTGDSDIIKQS